MSRLQQSADKESKTTPVCAALDRIAAGLEACRNELVERLVALKAQFDQCPDEARQEWLRQQLALVVDRIRDLDRLTTAQAEGREPWVAPERLEAPFHDLQTQLVEDEQVLRVQARTVAELVDRVYRDGVRALVFLSEESRLPRELVQDMQSSRKQLQSVLDELAGARHSVRQAVHEGADRRTGLGQGSVPEDLIEQVQQIASDRDSVGNVSAGGDVSDSGEGSD